MHRSVSDNGLTVPLIFLVLFAAKKKKKKKKKKGAEAERIEVQSEEPPEPVANIHENRPPGHHNEGQFGPGAEFDFSSQIQKGPETFPPPRPDEFPPPPEQGPGDEFGPPPPHLRRGGDEFGPPPFMHRGPHGREDYDYEYGPPGHWEGEDYGPLPPMYDEYGSPGPRGRGRYPRRGRGGYDGPYDEDFGWRGRGRGGRGRPYPRHGHYDGEGYGGGYDGGYGPDEDYGPDGYGPGPHGPYGPGFHRPPGGHGPHEGYGPPGPLMGPDGNRMHENFDHYGQHGPPRPGYDQNMGGGQPPFPPQGYSQEGYPQEGYPQEGYPQEGSNFPPDGTNYPPQQEGQNFPPNMFPPNMEGQQFSGEVFAQNAGQQMPGFPGVPPVPMPAGVPPPLPIDAMPTQQTAENLIAQGMNPDLAKILNAGVEFARVEPEPSPVKEKKKKKKKSKMGPQPEPQPEPNPALSLADVPLPPMSIPLPSDVPLPPPPPKREKKKAPTGVPFPECFPLQQFQPEQPPLPVPPPLPEAQAGLPEEQPPLPPPLPVDTMEEVEMEDAMSSEPDPVPPPMPVLAPENMIVDQPVAADSVAEPPFIHGSVNSLDNQEIQQPAHPVRKSRFDPDWQPEDKVRAASPEPQMVPPVTIVPDVQVHTAVVEDQFNASLYDDAIVESNDSSEASNGETMRKGTSDRDTPERRKESSMEVQDTSEDSTRSDSVATDVKTEDGYIYYGNKSVKQEVKPKEQSQTKEPITASQLLAKFKQRRGQKSQDSGSGPKAPVMPPLPIIERPVPAAKEEAKGSGKFTFAIRKLKQIEAEQEEEEKQVLNALVTGTENVDKSADKPTSVKEEKSSKQNKETKNKAEESDFKKDKSSKEHERSSKDKHKKAEASERSKRSTSRSRERRRKSDSRSASRDRRSRSTSRSRRSRYRRSSSRSRRSRSADRYRDRSRSRERKRRYSRDRSYSRERSVSRDRRSRSRDRRSRDRRSRSRDRRSRSREHRSRSRDRKERKRSLSPWRRDREFFKRYGRMPRGGEADHITVESISKRSKGSKEKEKSRKSKDSKSRRSRERDSYERDIDTNSKEKRRDQDSESRDRKRDRDSESKERVRDRESESRDRNRDSESVDRKKDKKAESSQKRDKVSRERSTEIDERVEKDVHERKSFDIDNKDLMKRREGRNVSVDRESDSEASDEDRSQDRRNEVRTSEPKDPIEFKISDTVASDTGSRISEPRSLGSQREDGEISDKEDQDVGKEADKQLGKEMEVDRRVDLKGSSLEKENFPLDESFNRGQEAMQFEYDGKNEEEVGTKRRDERSDYDVENERRGKWEKKNDVESEGSSDAEEQLSRKKRYEESKEKMLVEQRDEEHVREVSRKKKDKKVMSDSESDDYASKKPKRKSDRYEDMETDETDKHFDSKPKKKKDRSRDDSMEYAYPERYGRHSKTASREEEYVKERDNKYRKGREISPRDQERDKKYKARYEKDEDYRSEERSMPKLRREADASSSDSDGYGYKDRKKRAQKYKEKRDDYTSVEKMTKSKWDSTESSDSEAEYDKRMFREQGRRDFDRGESESTAASSRSKEAMLLKEKQKYDIDISKISKMKRLDKLMKARGGQKSNDSQDSSDEDEHAKQKQKKDKHSKKKGKKDKKKFDDSESETEDSPKGKKKKKTKKKKKYKEEEERDERQSKKKRLSSEEISDAEEVKYRKDPRKRKGKKDYDYEEHSDMDVSESESKKKKGDKLKKRDKDKGKKQKKYESEESEDEAMYKKRGKGKTSKHEMEYQSTEEEQFEMVSKKKKKKTGRSRHSSESDEEMPEKEQVFDKKRKKKRTESYSDDEEDIEDSKSYKKVDRVKKHRSKSIESNERSSVRSKRRGIREDSRENDRKRRDSSDSESYQKDYKQKIKSRKEKLIREEKRRDSSERKARRDSSERKTRRDSSERKARRDSSERKARRDSSERKARRDSSERKARRDSSERKVRRDSSERKVRRDSSERKARRDSSERKARRDSSERKARRDSTERKVRRDSSERKARRESSERKLRRDSSERKARRDSSERKVRRDSSEGKVIRDSIERKARRDSSERKVRRGSSERQVRRDSNDKKGRRDSSERKVRRDSSERKVRREDNSERRNRREADKKSRDSSQEMERGKTRRYDEESSPDRRSSKRREKDEQRRKREVSEERKSKRKHDSSPEMERIRKRNRSYESKSRSTSRTPSRTKPQKGSKADRRRHSSDYSDQEETKQKEKRRRRNASSSEDDREDRKVRQKKEDVKDRRREKDQERGRRYSYEESDQDYGRSPPVKRSKYKDSKIRRSVSSERRLKKDRGRRKESYNSSESSSESSGSSSDSISDDDRKNYKSKRTGSKNVQAGASSSMELVPGSQMEKENTKLDKVVESVPDKEQKRSDDGLPQSELEVGKKTDKKEVAKSKHKKKKSHKRKSEKEKTEKESLNKEPFLKADKDLPKESEKKLEIDKADASHSSEIFKGMIVAEKLKEEGLSKVELPKQKTKTSSHDKAKKESDEMRKGKGLNLLSAYSTDEMEETDSSVDKVTKTEKKASKLKSKQNETEQKEVIAKEDVPSVKGKDDSKSKSKLIDKDTKSLPLIENEACVKGVSLESDNFAVEDMDVDSDSSNSRGFNRLTPPFQEIENDVNSNQVKASSKLDGKTSTQGLEGITFEVSQKQTKSEKTFKEADAAEFSVPLVSKVEKEKILEESKVQDDLYDPFECSPDILPEIQTSDKVDDKDEKGKKAEAKPVQSSVLPSISSSLQTGQTYSEQVQGAALAIPPVLPALGPAPGPVFPVIGVPPVLQPVPPIPEPVGVSPTVQPVNFTAPVPPVGPPSSSIGMNPTAPVGVPLTLPAASVPTEDEKKVGVSDIAEVVTKPIEDSKKQISMRTIIPVEKSKSPRKKKSRWDTAGNDDGTVNTKEEKTDADSKKGDEELYDPFAIDTYESPPQSPKKMPTVDTETSSEKSNLEGQTKVKMTFTTGRKLIGKSALGLDESEVKPWTISPKKSKRKSRFSDRPPEEMQETKDSVMSESTSSATVTTDEKEVAPDMAKEGPASEKKTKKILEMDTKHEAPSKSKSKKKDTISHSDSEKSSLKSKDHFLVESTLDSNQSSSDAHPSRNRSPEKKKIKDRHEDLGSHKRDRSGSPLKEKKEAFLSKGNEDYLSDEKEKGSFQMDISGSSYKKGEEGTGSKKDRKHKKRDRGSTEKKQDYEELDKSPSRSHKRSKDFDNDSDDVDLFSKKSHSHSKQTQKKSDLGLEYFEDSVSKDELKSPLKADKIKHEKKMKYTETIAKDSSAFSKLCETCKSLEPGIAQNCECRKDMNIKLNRKKLTVQESEIPLDTNGDNKIRSSLAKKSVSDVQLPDLQITKGEADETDKESLSRKTIVSKPKEETDMFEEIDAEISFKVAAPEKSEADDNVGIKDAMKIVEKDVDKTGAINTDAYDTQKKKDMAELKDELGTDQASEASTTEEKLPSKRARRSSSKTDAAPRPVKRLTRRAAAEQKVVLPPVMSKDMPTRGKRGRRSSVDPLVADVQMEEEEKSGVEEITEMDKGCADTLETSDDRVKKESEDLPKDDQEKPLKLEQSDADVGETDKKEVSPSKPVSASSVLDMTEQINANLKILANKLKEKTEVSLKHSDTEYIGKGKISTLKDKEIQIPKETPVEIEKESLVTDVDKQQLDVKSMEDVKDKVTSPEKEKGLQQVEKEKLADDAQQKGFTMKFVPSVLRKSKQDKEIKCLDKVFDMLDDASDAKKPLPKLKEHLAPLSFGLPEFSTVAVATEQQSSNAGFSASTDTSNQPVSKIDAKDKSREKGKDKDSGKSNPVRHGESTNPASDNPHPSSAKKPHEKAHSSFKPLITHEQLGNAIQVIGQENLRRIETLQRESARLMQEKGNKIEVLGQSKQIEVVGQPKQSEILGQSNPPETMPIQVVERTRPKKPHSSGSTERNNRELLKLEDKDLFALEREKEQLMTMLDTQPAQAELEPASRELPVIGMQDLSAPFETTESAYCESSASVDNRNKEYQEEIGREDEREPDERAIDRTREHRHEDRDMDQDSRSRERGRDRDREDRDRDRTRDRDHEDRDRDRDRKRDRDRDRDDRDRYESSSRRNRKDDDYEEKKSRRERERYRSRDRSRERSRDRDSHRGRDRKRSRERERSRERDRSRERRHKKRKEHDDRYDRHRNSRRSRSRSWSRDSWDRGRDRRSRSRGRRSRSRDRRSRSRERRSRSRGRRSRSRERRSRSRERRSRSRDRYRSRRSRSRSRERRSRSRDREREAKKKDRGSSKEKSSKISALEKFEKELAEKKKVLLQPVTGVSQEPKQTDSPVQSAYLADQQFPPVDGSSAHYLPQPFPVHEQPMPTFQGDQVFPPFPPDQQQTMFQQAGGPPFYGEGMPTDPSGMPLMPGQPGMPEHGFPPQMPMPPEHFAQGGPPGGFPQGPPFMDPNFMGQMPPGPMGPMPGQEHENMMYMEPPGPHGLIPPPPPGQFDPNMGPPPPPERARSQSIETPPGHVMEPGYPIEGGDQQQYPIQDNTNYGYQDEGAFKFGVGAPGVPGHPPVKPKSRLFNNNLAQARKAKEESEMKSPPVQPTLPALQVKEEAVKQEGQGELSVLPKPEKPEEGNLTPVPSPSPTEETKDPNWSASVDTSHDTAAGEIAVKTEITSETQEEPVTDDFGASTEASGADDVNDSDASSDKPMKVKSRWRRASEAEVPPPPPPASKKKDKKGAKGAETDGEQKNKAAEGEVKEGAKTETEEDDDKVPITFELIDENVYLTDR